jgi:hypothetical protein
MPGLWFVISSNQGVETDHIRPARAVVGTVRLTVCLMWATLIAVVRKHVPLAGAC